MSSTQDEKPNPPEALELEQESPPEYPETKKVLAIIAALYIGAFLVALDRTIISTAIPKITDVFDSLGDVGWYGSAYMLTNCTFQLVFGKLYTIITPKWVYLGSVVIFMIGSTLCGAAPSSNVFILGRAIQGLGSAGAFTGGVIIISMLVPIHKRAAYTGVLGSLFGVTAVIGPLMGGAFTSNVSWRWCFYINLPIGALTLLLITLLLPTLKPALATKGWKEKVSQFDPIGTVLFLPAIVSLILALQWGGTTYAWSNGRIIGLLCVFGVLIIAFAVVQWWKEDKATVPLRIIKQRSIAASLWFILCAAGSMMSMVYYLPIWFQVIKGSSPVHAGIQLLPFILSLVVATILAGFLTQKLGYYTQFPIMGAIFASIGAGLITTFKPDTPKSVWIGYQILYGFGLGIGMQSAGLTAQVVLPRKDTPMGIALVFFGQQLGGAVFVSVAQNIFATSLVSGLSKVHNLPAADIVNNGLTKLKDQLAFAELKTVLGIYNNALVDTFRIAVVLSAVSILGAVCIEWKSVKPLKEQSRKAAEMAKEKAAADAC